MNNRIRKTIKTLVITLVSIILLVLGLIAFTLNFIFTPEKITPTVLRVANQTMNAKLDMESVELTFFSTFPRFGLKLTNGSLVSKALNDTLWQKTDSLLDFRKCVLVVSPLDYLNNKIRINRLVVDSASVYAFTNKEGLSNWDIMKSDSTETDTTSATKMQQDIDIKRLVFRRTNLVFDDRATRVYTSLQGANLQLQASLQKEQSVLDLSFSNKNIIFWQDGKLLAHRISTSLETSIMLERSKKLLTLHNAALVVNGTEMDINGTLRGDSIKRALDIDLNYAMHAPSLEKVINMIPRSILKKGEMKASGAVSLNGSIKGLYGKDYMPTIVMDMKIDEASAKYKDLPYGIDKITADFSGKIDMMKKDTSFLHLKIFHFKGAHTEILADAKVDNLFGDPDITLNTTSEIDLTALSQTFPLQEGIVCEGKINANIRMRCKLSTLKKQDLGRIKMKGKINLDKLAITDTIHNFKFTGDAKFNFKGNELLEADAEINQINLDSPFLKSNIEKATAEVKSTNPKDTTRIVELDCKINLSKLKANQNDSLQLFCQKTSAGIKLSPSEKDFTKPKVKLTFNADSFFCRFEDMKFGMDKAGFAVTAEKVNDSIWDPKGIIGFRNLIMRTPEIALPVRMQKTALTVGNRKISLKNATMKIGRSDITATGSVYNLYESLKKNKKIKAELAITSNNLNCNQLIRAMASPSDSIESEQDTTSTDLSLFVVPENFDFELSTKLKRVRYGKMIFENVSGDVDIKNQAIHLKNLSMTSIGAKMKSMLVYQASEKEKGYVGFDFQLRNVDISRLVDFVPSLDSTVPMLRSFEGVVDFNVTAETALDSCLNIKIPTLRSAMFISGDSLVLMDGETFAEISKMLMFKNKKRNVFDHIETNITIEDGNVTIYPFLLEIDRYRAAVGGTQGLDMNFDYHISILKSPVPFKMGINITGNLDDMKIRLGKAKYKDAVSPVEIRKVDSTRINMGRNIIEEFRKLVERAQ